MDRAQASSTNDPLSECAPLARQLAPTLCRKDPATGESCAWYHGFWPVVRLMGFGTGPRHHAEFFRMALQPLAQLAAPRVLVSGAADYSMPAHVLAALGKVTPQVVVIDRCETPLALCRWYAGRLGATIETHPADALEYAEPRKYDAVCTHSFIGQIHPGRRPSLLARWRELLRPGGLVVTVNRLRPDRGEGWVGFSAAQARDFRDAVREKAQSLRATLGAEPEQLVREAEAYAARVGAWPVRSREELAELFAHAGFRVEHLAVAMVEPSAGASLSGPTAPGGAAYAQVIARLA